MAVSKQKLTGKQQRFVEEYVVDLNATQACIRAGYAPKAASVTGTRTLANAKVQAALAKVLTKRSKRTEITADNVLREYARLAFADVTDVVSVRGSTVTVKSFEDLPKSVTAAIAEVSETKDGLRLKFHSKTQALEALSRHLGLFNDKLHVEGRLSLRPDMSALSDDDLRDLRKRLPAPPS